MGDGWLITDGAVETVSAFEVFAEELEEEVGVQAVCSGELIMKDYVSGYGGVVIQECTLDEEPITVVYGHLDLSSVSTNVGVEINGGDVIGNLGADKSTETDGERQHLHLGFYKGTEINVKGYVTSESELDAWIDTCLSVCSN